MKLIKQNEMTLFVIVLVLQLIYMIYWGTQKSGFYVDEFFTLDNTHYISASTPNRIKLYDAEFLTYGQWHNIADLKGTLMVTREESLLSDAVSYHMRAWLKKNPYMILLNYVEAIFFDGKLSKWSAIALNIVLFFINQIVLYKLTCCISKSKEAATVAIALYGFSGMAASMTVYVRFYMLATLLTTVYTYLHVIIWNTNELRKNLLMEAASLIVLYYSYKSSTVAAIYGIGMILIFTIALLISKRYCQAAWYGIPIVGGGIFYLAFMTNYLTYLVNPQKYANAALSNVAAASLLGNFVSLNWHNCIGRVEELAHLICRYLFGHALILGIYLLAAVVLLCLYIKSMKNKKERMDPCFWIVFGSCMFFCIVSVCLKLGTVRYNSSVFPEFAVCIAVIAVYFSKSARHKWLITPIMLALVLGEVIFTCYIPRVDNLYPEDRAAIAKIREYEGVDSVVIDYHFDDKIMYECLAYADQESKVLFTSYEEIDYTLWGEQVLVWQSVNQEQKTIDELHAAGYFFVEEVARTHESIVYLAER